MIRLSPETLDRLPAEVTRPAYDRTTIRTGVVHLGIGAFHRAHQADVFDRALAAGDPRWGVLGASLRSPGVRDQLVPQGGLYSLVVRDGERLETRIVGAVRQVLVAPERPSAVVAALAAPETHLVTLTVTEKGYRLDPASGALIESDPEVAADLSSLAAPRTAPGFLAAGLAQRRARGLGPLTVISCDNLPHNGARVRDAVLAVARRHDPDLADWIEGTCAFPQTMIDRIVPATTPQDRRELAARLGVDDHGVIKTEPFTQWVIEDRFAGPRPDFEGLGVQITSAVGPYEDAKLRLLNGAHSAMAYLGGLAGLGFVHQVAADPVFSVFVERLWDEAAATLDPPAGLDLSVYRRALKARFANAALEHRTHQIAMDGSQKLPQRLLAGAVTRLDRGLPIAALALAVAAWMRWQDGVDETGAAHVVDDPLAAETARLVAHTPDPLERAAALLSLEAVFPRRLATDPRFTVPVIAAYVRLSQSGARAAASFVGSLS
ncbi:mannitol dehydrogenase family protein [Brevundimonas bacteroides]|uniref:mannitol dehydrogenase family protein n=1 Tax=Brevundimonas bacteroides TaxID=74311 RepID=UPI0004984B75|nr:mannitol dehydrogenase family protein [Brevundimonas bacteroides]